MGDCAFGNNAENPRIFGDEVRDNFCLGPYESDANLCASTLTFCAVTSTSATQDYGESIFRNINGIVGFAPVPAENIDAEMKSFIYQTNNTVDKVSWNFNYDGTPSTVMLGGKN